MQFEAQWAYAIQWNNYGLLALALHMPIKINLLLLANRGLLIAWLIYALSKIRVARDAHLLWNDSTGKIASTDRDSHESENIQTRPLYRILMQCVIITYFSF